MSVHEKLLNDFYEFAKKEGVLKSMGLVLDATKVNQLTSPVLETARNFSLLMPGVGAQGAVIEGRLESILTSQSHHLLPVSRGVAGLGDPKQKDALDDLKTWDDYSSYVLKRCQDLK
jgi:orotidine-5'-phosphate decarboxylase